MGKRFAIVIGVAAAGAMALGAQTAAACGRSEGVGGDVVKYDTELNISRDGGGLYHGSVESEVRRCERDRRVVLLQAAARGGSQARH